MNDRSTIAAISTPQGKGGIAIIRVSGPKAIQLVDELFYSAKGKKLASQRAGTTHFGEIRKANEVVDEVLATVFHAPHSFTGEDTVEISCHGSSYIQQHILQLLIEQGAHLAAPGEFSQRAFLNGKMDLSQAEGVADLIASSSAAAHRLAINQMRGGFSTELQKLRAQLLDFVSLVELELDFGEEDVEFADRSQLKNSALKTSEAIRKLADSFSTGNAIKHGIPVAIVGETNVGKSTLLNLLLNEDRAIVSDVHGTTRDVIEDITSINGVTFRFIDTAGIRDTDDRIERIGIERSFTKMRQADIVLWMVDALSEKTHIYQLSNKIMPLIKGKKLIVVLNKIDLLDDEERIDKERMLGLLASQSEVLSISATRLQHTQKLAELLVKAAHLPEIGENDVIISNIRHYEALTKALNALERTMSGLNKGISGDFLAQDIRECMHHLGEITGQIATDEILGNIFSRFCIGK